MVFFPSTAERHQTNNSATPTTNGKAQTSKEPHNGSTSLKFDGSSGSTTSTGNQESTWVHEIFQGILTSETRCLNCETVSSELLISRVSLQRNADFIEMSVMNDFSSK